MSKSNGHNPTTDDTALHEELVAYLDGELDADQSRRIEQRAVAEPNTRRTLEDLDRTWHMLDELQAPATNEDFTHTTLEMVAVAAEDDARKAKADLPRRRTRARMAALAAVAGMGAAGFLLVAYLTPDPNAQLLKDLPILENFEQYRQVDNIKFLRTLTNEKLFTENTDDGQ